MYWEADKECMKRDEIGQLQLERLQSTLYRVYMNVPFYRKKFDELSIDPDGVHSLDRHAGPREIHPYHPLGQVAFGAGGD